MTGRPSRGLVAGIAAAVAVVLFAAAGLSLILIARS
jgi:hypothetical protein